jgi:hypothetical protein
MRNRTFTIHLPGRWLGVALVVVLIGVLVPPVAIAAGGSFTDDDASIFEADIEWLAGAGVTKGCNPPTNDRFCPNDSVTRGQMAAFMRRFAQFLGAEDGTPADADRLNGRNLNQVRPAAAWWSGEGLPNTIVSEDLTVTVPAGGGTLLMVGSFDYLNTAATSQMVTCNFRLDGNPLLDSERLTFADPLEWGVCSTNIARDVGAGPYTITFESGTSLSLVTLDPGRASFHVTVIPSG